MYIFSNVLHTIKFSKQSLWNDSIIKNFREKKFICSERKNREHIIVNFHRNFPNKFLLEK